MRLPKVLRLSGFEPTVALYDVLYSRLLLQCVYVLCVVPQQLPLTLQHADKPDGTGTVGRLSGAVGGENRQLRRHGTNYFAVTKMTFFVLKTSFPKMGK